MKKWVSLFLLLWSIKVWGFTVVSLKETVVLSKDRIVLGDIAEIKGELSYKLKKIYVSQAPLPGEVRVIPMRLVEARLKQGRYRDVKLVGENKVEVKRKAQLLRRERIETELKELLDARRPAEIYNPTYRFSRIPEVLYLPEGDLSLKFEFDEKHLNYRGGNFVKVLIFIEGKKIEELRIGVDIESMVETVVSAKPIPRGKIIESSDLKVILKRYRSIPRDAFQKIDHLMGKRAKHFIDEGLNLTPRDVEIPPAVERGDRVTLILREGGIELSTSGQAREDARLGEKIWVRNESTGKMVQGVVVEPSVVEVIID